MATTPSLFSWKPGAVSWPQDFLFLIFHGASKQCFATSKAHLLPNFHYHDELTLSYLTPRYCSFLLPALPQYKAELPEGTWRAFKNAGNSAVPSFTWTKLEAHLMLRALWPSDEVWTLLPCLCPSLLTPGLGLSECINPAMLLQPVFPRLLVTIWHLSQYFCSLHPQRFCEDRDLMLLSALSRVIFGLDFLFCFCYFLVFWGRVSLSWSSSCRLGWPWIHRDPPASVSRVLGLKVCTAMLSWCPLFINKKLVNNSWVDNILKVS